jgi:hypothetical protein
LFFWKLAWERGQPVKLCGLGEQGESGMPELPIALSGAPFSSLGSKIAGRFWKAR